jgi:hypothetical protein
MSALREAFRSGRSSQQFPTKASHGEKPVAEKVGFEAGATWVREVLRPAIERANLELAPEGVTIKLELNLDPRSTNHAHADFWFSELHEGHCHMGLKYSLNVKGEQVWLYKAGTPGRVLGRIKDCGTEHIEDVLREGAKEFGAQISELASC